MPALISYAPLSITSVFAATVLDDVDCLLVRGGIVNRWKYYSMATAITADDCLKTVLKHKSTSSRSACVRSRGPPLVLNPTGAGLSAMHISDFFPSLAIDSRDAAAFEGLISGDFAAKSHGKGPTTTLARSSSGGSHPHAPFSSGRWPL